MPALLAAIAITLAISFLCSLFEAMILSTNMLEIDALRPARPKAAAVLERLRQRLDETISAILTLNTIANIAGSMVIGSLAAGFFNHNRALIAALSAALTLVILIFAEVLPKNIGVAHRDKLQPLLAHPLLLLCRALRPVTWACNLLVRLFVKTPPPETASGEQIRLLAERGARQGTLNAHESSIIANALSLDDVRISHIMTPRTVVTALPARATIAEVFKSHPNIPFGRLPVFGKNMDDITGIVRRRDLLKAKANDLDTETVGRLMQEVHFVPETVTAADALHLILKVHQKLLVVVDEFGSTTGVVTMEDIMEHILGREIFEKDDIAVDMREFARKKNHTTTRQN
jgi:CBS domain containing-hemolysin-like protein